MKYGFPKSAIICDSMPYSFDLVVNLEQFSQAASISNAKSCFNLNSHPDISPGSITEFLASSTNCRRGDSNTQPIIDLALYVTNVRLKWESDRFEITHDEVGVLHQRTSEAYSSFLRIGLLEQSGVHNDMVDYLQREREGRCL